MYHRGSWEQCSRTCIRNLDETSVKKRTRSCIPSDCLVGKVETIDCGGNEVKFCPPKIPEFSDVTFESDEENPAQMKAHFSLDKAEVLYGTVLEQSISFENVGKFHLPTVHCKYL